MIDFAPRLSSTNNYEDSSLFLMQYIHKIFYLALDITQYSAKSVKYLVFF